MLHPWRRRCQVLLRHLLLAPCKPPLYLQESYADMGYPVIIKRGTTGWNDEPSMREFLLEFRSVVYSVDAELWIVLVLDICKIRTSKTCWRT